MTKNVPPPPDSEHESSSLFSLSSLEQMASGKHGSIKIPTEEEGSGLLDIHALSEAAAHSNRVVPRPTPMPALLKGPIVAQATGMPMRVKAALGVMAVTIFALGGATLYLATRHAPELAVQAEPAPELTAPAAAGAAPAQQVALAAPTTVVRQAQPGQVAAPVAPVVPAEPPRRAHKARGDAPATSHPVVAGPAPQEVTKSPSDRSMDDLLAGALTPGAKKVRTAPMAAGPTTPSRDDVLAAMQQVAPKVKACHGTGMAVVKVTVSGRTGHVTDVVVDGQSDATVRACVVHEVSRAKMSPFANPSFSVTYPFKL